jgi:AraC-like DNA-binding protein
VVDQAREALAGDLSLELPALARLVGCSPFHLSRVFRRETGTTVSAHRLRLRVREAREQIAAGEENLARLAAELGFSDHSHLTRMLVRELGATPSAIRASIFKPAGGGPRGDPRRRRAQHARRPRRRGAAARRPPYGLHLRPARTRRQRRPPEREIEDLAALVEHAGSSAGRVHRGRANFLVDSSRPPLPEEFVPHLDVLADVFAP